MFVSIKESKAKEKRIHLALTGGWSAGCVILFMKKLDARRMKGTDWRV